MLVASDNIPYVNFLIYEKEGLSSWYIKGYRVSLTTCV